MIYHRIYIDGLYKKIISEIESYYKTIRYGSDCSFDLQSTIKNILDEINKYEFESRSKQENRIINKE